MRAYRNRKNARNASTRQDDPNRATIPRVASAAQTAPRARRSASRGVKPPSALTERRLSLICEKIAHGVPMTTAAIAAGVPRRTFQEWLAKGRADGAPEPYAGMAERIESALACYHESRVELVQAGAERDPRMAQWELERRFKDDWGDPRAGAGQVNISVTLAAERKSAAEQIAEAAVRVLAHEPELLERLLAELGGGQVINGEAIEVAEIAAAE